MGIIKFRGEENAVFSDFVMFGRIESQNFYVAYFLHSIAKFS